MYFLTILLAVCPNINPTILCAHVCDVNYAACYCVIRGMIGGTVPTSNIKIYINSLRPRDSLFIGLNSRLSASSNQDITI